MNGGDGGSHRFISNQNASNLRFAISRGGANTFALFGANTSGTTNLTITTSSTILAGSGWHIILASWDIGTDDNHIYLDGSSDISVTTSDNTNIDYTSVQWAVGADGNAGANKFNGDIDVLYLNLAEKIDFSSSTNRLKFFDAAGKWVPSRMDGGQEPTGNQPIIYLPGTYRSFSANHGSGGGFNVTGALTESA